MNDPYLNEWGTFQNFFCFHPETQGEAVRQLQTHQKNHPTPNTLPAIAEVQSHSFRNKKLAVTFRPTNPFVLKRIIQAKLKIIFNALK